MSIRTDQLHALRATTEHLGEPAEAQIAYLTVGGSPRSTDELALEFDDFYPSVRHWIADDALARALAELDQTLDEMSSPDRANLWSFEGLTAPEWCNVRSRARIALACNWDVTAAPDEQSNESQ